MLDVYFLALKCRPLLSIYLSSLAPHVQLRSRLFRTVRKVKQQ
jgi:hypothetical protein